MKYIRYTYIHKLSLVLCVSIYFTKSGVDGYIMSSYGDSLYVTLPSNASYEEFPENTNTKYRVRLDHPLLFESNVWEAGLVEMQYPTMWDNVTEGVVRISRLANAPLVEDSSSIAEARYAMAETSSELLNIRKGRYKNIGELVKELNKAIEKYGDEIIFSYDQIQNVSRITIRSENTLVVLSEDLHNILGFTTKKWFTKDASGKMEYDSDADPDIHQGFTSLFVYCNLTQPRPVGDKMVSLLRTVPVQSFSKTATSRGIEFTNIHYLPVANTSTDTVLVDIRRDNGESVPFRGGKVILTLHFRRKK